MNLSGSGSNDAEGRAHRYLGALAALGDSLAKAEGRQEVARVGRELLGRADDVALVLAFVVVAHHQQQVVPQLPRPPPPLETAGDGEPAGRSPGLGPVRAQHRLFLFPNFVFHSCR